MFAVAVGAAFAGLFLHGGEDIGLGFAFHAGAQFDHLVIECSAAELHLQNENYEPFRIGQMIRCRSIPHLIDKTFPLVKLTLRLDTAAKQITLGTAVRESLTRIYKDARGADSSQEENPATEAEIESLRERVDGMQDQIDGIVSGEHWIHQMDGVTLTSGTVNFITGGGT